MKTNTANAIKTLLRMDPTVTPDERMAIIEVMSGKRDVAAIELTNDYTIAEAAAYLGLGRVTIWEHCKHGKILAEQRGKKFFIPGTELLRLKARKANQPVNTSEHANDGEGVDAPRGEGAAGTSLGEVA